MWNPLNIFKRKEVVSAVSIPLDKILPGETVWDAIERLHLPVDRAQILGDGKAEFLGEGSSDEFEEQEKKDKGQHGIFGIGI